MVRLQQTYQQPQAAKWTKNKYINTTLKLVKVVWWILLVIFFVGILNARSTLSQVPNKITHYYPYWSIRTNNAVEFGIKLVATFLSIKQITSLHRLTANKNIDLLYIFRQPLHLCWASWMCIIHPKKSICPPKKGSISKGIFIFQLPIIDFAG